MRWKEVSAKSLMAFVAGAVAEFSVSRSLDWETLLVAIVLGGLRGVVNILSEWNVKSTETKSFSWKSCL